MLEKESLRYKKRQDLLKKSQENICVVRNVGTQTILTLFHVAIWTSEWMVVNAFTGQSKEVLSIQLFRVPR